MIVVWKVVWNGKKESAAGGQLDQIGSIFSCLVDTIFGSPLLYAWPKASIALDGAITNLWAATSLKTYEALSYDLC